MSETNAQEPTMEEILASIRKIISEDDAPAAEPAPAAAAAPEPSVALKEPPLASKPPPAAAEPERPEPPAAPAAAAPADDDVLDLTDPVDPEPVAASTPHYEEALGDLDVFSHAPPPSPTFSPSAPSFPAEPLVGDYASEATAGHFGALARSVSMPREGRSLEDVVRELLKPMLRDWLDQHLPGIVEARVQAEVERIARRHDY